MIRVALILLSIAALQADDKEKRFAPGAASSYPFHETSEKITIAAIPYITEEQAKTAFGKVNPYKEGVLPVLVVIDNNTGRAVRVTDLKVAYIDADGRQTEPTPARDVPFLEGPKRPKMPGTGVNLPNPLPRKPKRNALDTWEIDGRAFSHKMIPPGDSVNGFFYFQVPHRPGAKIYINGLRDAATGKEFFFFEVRLDKGPA